MTGFRLNIEQFGSRQVSRRILRFGEHAADLSPAFERVVELFARVGWEQFASEGRYASGGWDPLADSTVAQKGNDVILFDSGDLEESLTSTRPNSLTRVKISHDELEWFSQVPYGVWHMQGTSRMPRRPPWELRDRDRRKVIRELQRELVEGVL